MQNSQNAQCELTSSPASLQRSQQRSYTQTTPQPTLSRRPSLSSYRSSSIPTPTPPSRAPSPSGSRPTWGGSSMRSASPVGSRSYRSPSPAPSVGMRMGGTRGASALGRGVQRPGTAAVRDDLLNAGWMEEAYAFFSHNVGHHGREELQGAWLDGVQSRAEPAPSERLTVPSLIRPGLHHSSCIHAQAPLHPTR